MNRREVLVGTVASVAAAALPVVPAVSRLETIVYMAVDGGMQKLVESVLPSADP
jgi:hypothetical protein